MFAIGRHVTKLSGYAPAVPTPFAADGCIDCGAFERFCARQIAEGATALVVCGTTGEAPARTPTEHRKLIWLASRRRAAACRSSPAPARTRPRTRSHSARTPKLQRALSVPHVGWAHRNGRQAKKIQEWLLAILRFAITLEPRDRQRLLAIAQEMDGLGFLPGHSSFSYFMRTSTDGCHRGSRLSRPAPLSSAGTSRRSATAICDGRLLRRSIFKAL